MFGVRRASDRGFTMIELLFVLAAIITMTAIAVPNISNLMQSQRAADGARTVERELQVARLQAVSTSKSMRVRLNCPAAGQLRILEVTGVDSTDTDAQRCDPATYPSPGPIDTLQATPSLDSPVVYLSDGVTVTSTVTIFQFDPDGRVGSVVGGVETPIGTGTTITVSYATYTHTVSINGFGRIKID